MAKQENLWETGFSPRPEEVVKVQGPRLIPEKQLPKELEEIDVENVSWQFFINNIFDMLRKLVRDFTGGNLGNCIKFWETMTSDEWILNTIQGMEIKFDKVPYQKSIPKGITFNEAEHEIMDEEIKKMLSKNVIEVATDDNEQEFISNIFLRPKKDGSHRVILNLKLFNENVEKKHFKMQSLFSAIELMTENCYMASIDWKDAYYSLPIHPRDRRFLRFYWNGIKYQYGVLPNGLASGPGDFTKVTKVIFSKLREKGFLNASYLDDSLLAGEDIPDCKKNVMNTVAIGLKSGFVVHPEKSVLVPTQIIEYLGFILNSIHMEVSLTERRKEDLVKLCKNVYKQKMCTIQTIAQLVGKMVATIPGIKYAKIYYRVIDNEKNDALKLNKGNYQGKMKLSEQAYEDILWWIQNIKTASNPIKIEPFSITIQTDACDTGWGGVVKNHKTGGKFGDDELKLHINQKELLAVLLTLQSL